MKRSRIALLVGFVLLLTTPAHAERYQKMLEGRRLTAGLGFEGVVTVYDETTRMYDRLGTPETPSPQHYRYEAGDFVIVVKAAYRDRRFLVQSIRYSSDSEKRLATRKGVRLGAGERAVMAAYGIPESRADGELVYATQGITFTLRKSGVSAIQVYRPREAPRVEKSPEQPDTPVRMTAPATSGLGLILALPTTWTVTHSDDSKIVAQSTGKAAELVAEACTACAATLGEWVRTFEADRRPNALPASIRDVERRWLSTLGADSGYAGLYENPKGREWLLALRRGRRAWKVRIALNTSAPLNQTLFREVSDMLLGLRIAP